MKKILATLFSNSISFLFCQQPNWGFAPPITVSGSSSITCSVFDTDLGQTKTTTQSGVANYINTDGVVAWVSSGGTVGGIVYDMNLHNFKSTTFSSNSGNTISNTAGIIAFVSSAGTVGGAVYDFCLQQWKYTTFSSNSGNSVKNSQGVIAFVSSAGTVGGAVYDPDLQQWKYTTFSSNSGNAIENSQGIISYVSSAGTVGGAVYDIADHSWEYTTFSSNSGNIVVNKDGVIAYKSSAGTVGAATYRFDSGSWAYTTFSSSSSNSNLSISDGTVKWTNSSGNQKAGFNGSSWSTGSETKLSCKFVAINNQDCTNEKMTNFWCMSIGANSYSYTCGDGHSITRRWAWKRYKDGGTYRPELNVSNSKLNSSCDADVDLPTSIKELKEHLVLLKQNPVKNYLEIESGNKEIDEIEIFDIIGNKVITEKYETDLKTIKINCSQLPAGLYLATFTSENSKTKTLKFWKE